MKWFSLLLLPALTAGIATAQPVVSAVANAAGNRLSGLPSSQLAPGAIGVVFGRGMGPAEIVIASGLPWPLTLGGTSAQIETGDQTIDLPLYYTSATQIAFLLPSNTPTGPARIRITYNGQTSALIGFGVVPSNLGIFTVNSQGSGPAIVTYPDYSLVSRTKDDNCGGPNTNCGAANPGQTLILWGTGLGAVTGDETTTPLPGDLTDVPLQLWIGGVSADVTYRGRSGCCVAEDQVVFVVPENISGCNVPIIAQINGAISNYATIAIAPSGSSCAPYNPSTPAGFLAQLPALDSPSFGYANFERDLSGHADTGEAGFFKLNGSGKLLADALDSPPLGTCTVTPFYNSDRAHGLDPFDALPLSLLDAGPSLAVSGPSGDRTLPLTAEGGYAADLGDASAGNYLDPGVYTIMGTGGHDVGSFNTTVTIPEPLVWTNPPAIETAVARANGLTINWTGGDPNGIIFIQGLSRIVVSVTDNTPLGGEEFQCTAAASAGTFLIPRTVLLTMPFPPANGQGRPVEAFIGLSEEMQPSLFTAPGIAAASALFIYDTDVFPVVYQ